MCLRTQSVTRRRPGINEPGRSIVLVQNEGVLYQSLGNLFQSPIDLHDALEIRSTSVASLETGGDDFTSNVDALVHDTTRG